MIFSISLQKGGVGKTTTVVNIASVLAQKGKKVCIVDLDSQNNIALCFGLKPEADKTIYHVVTEQSKLEEVIIRTEVGVDVIPAGEDLAELDLTIIQNTDVFKKPAFVIKDILASIESKYDYIFIDTPPSLSLTVINALVASDNVLITMQCEFMATAGVNRLLKTISKIKNAYNPNLQVAGIVGTMFDSRTNLSSSVLQEARKFFANTQYKVCDTVIPRSVKFADAAEKGKPAVLSFSNHTAVKAYTELVEEVFGI